jgi:uncharacterized membrane protein
MTSARFKEVNHYWGIISALAVASFVSFLIFILGVIHGHSWFYLFLYFNLGLAMVAPLLALWLVSRLYKSSWLNISNLLITLVWLAFLPNSFYMLTDLIHAQSSISFDLLFNIVLILSAALTALAAGYISVYMIHKALLKHVSPRSACLLIALVFAICSLGIYFGRYLRWNTWDIVVSPASLLFDLSDTFINPGTHPEVLVMTLTLFGLLTSGYLVIWQCAKTIKATD